MTGQPRILVVQHERGAPAGILGERLLKIGAALRVLRPYDGEAMPEPAEVADHDALVVLGGAMDAWDDAGHPWLAPTRALVAEAERRGVVTLGICLGHQLAATALGGTVGRNPAGPVAALVPMGWIPDAEGDPLLGSLTGASRALHWNQDVVIDPPPGAVVLARSPDDAVQAARLGRHVWGVQCHPEATTAIVRDWAGGEADTLGRWGVSAETLTWEMNAAEDGLRAAWAGLADALVAQARRAVRSGT